MDKQMGMKSKSRRKSSTPKIVSYKNINHQQNSTSLSDDGGKLIKRVCKDVNLAKARLHQCTDKLKAKPWKNNLLTGMSSTWCKRVQDSIYSNDNTLPNGNVQSEGIFYDISSNLKDVCKMKSVSTKALPNMKLKSVNLRREKIEKELSNLAEKPSSVISGPDLQSTKSYSLALFHTMLLSWDPSWLESEKYELEIVNKVNPIPIMFECYDNYINVFWPLLLLETWSYLCREWDNIHHSSTDYKLDSVEYVQTNNKSCQLTAHSQKLNPLNVVYHKAQY